MNHHTTLISLASLHQAIVHGLQCKLKAPVWIAAYPAIQRTLALPAVLIELTELEPGDDPGTGETALVAHLQARVMVDPNQPQAELSVRKLAAQVAVALTHEQWGLPITQAKLSRMGEALIKSDLEGYLAWSVEWSHELHLGRVVWPYRDESGMSLVVGFTADESLPSSYQLIEERAC
ncbi:hypothetical protein [unidentified bacterial endosymbiont]|uniref:hypothetical protein n=1 Tax=unidentified bacterial endosymbiont TaxID=2355 RepID=UPI00209DDDC2|nr:hypothetical protein [unidentified bacterial endosymbiont]